MKVQHALQIKKKTIKIVLSRQGNSQYVATKKKHEKKGKERLHGAEMMGEKSELSQ